MRERCGLVLTCGLPFRGGAFFTGSASGIGRIGDDNIERVGLNSSSQISNVPIERHDNVNKSIVLDILAEKAECLWFDLCGNDPRSREFPCKQNGNDSGSRARFEYKVARPYPAKISEEKTVQCKAKTFFRLSNAHNAGIAKRDAVKGCESHGRYFFEAGPQRKNPVAVADETLILFDFERDNVTLFFRHILQAGVWVLHSHRQRRPLPCIRRKHDGTFYPASHVRISSWLVSRH